MARRITIGWLALIAIVCTLAVYFACVPTHQKTVLTATAAVALPSAPVEYEKIGKNWQFSFILRDELRVRRARILIRQTTEDGTISKREVVSFDTSNGSTGEVRCLVRALFDDPKTLELQVSVLHPDGQESFDSKTVDNPFQHKSTYFPRDIIRQGGGSVRLAVELINVPQPSYPIHELCCELE